MYLVQHKVASCWNFLYKLKYMPVDHKSEDTYAMCHL